MIKLKDIMPDHIIRQVAENAFRQKVAEIRSGQVIRMGYRPLSVKKRAQHGLQTKYIDLTGNTSYSNHSWRLLDSWHVEVRDKKAILRWNNSDAERIYGYNVRRFGSIL